MKKIEKRINWIILDHYTLDNKWTNILKNSKSEFLEKVQYLIIDDLVNRKFNADIISIKIFYSSDLEKNKKFYGNKCQILMGPNFALLSKEYANMHKKAK